jgi:hypothetical protein
MRRTLTLLTVGLAGALVTALVVAAVPAEGVPNGGGPGDPLLLSRVNQAGPMTVLKSNGGFRILAKNPKRPPLMVYTPDSMPPLDVSSQAKVENLNVDLLDGLDSSAFSPIGHSHDGRYYTETESNARFVRSSDLALPIAAYAGGDQNLDVGFLDTIIRSVTLNPPAAGTVIVNSTVMVGERTAGHRAVCSITTGTAIDPTHQQEWDSSGESGYTTQMSATRGFSVAGGAPFTANLVCHHSGGTGPETTAFVDSALTAIFTPNP